MFHFTRYLTFNHIFSHLLQKGRRTFSTAIIETAFQILYTMKIVVDNKLILPVVLCKINTNMLTQKSCILKLKATAINDF